MEDIKQILAKTRRVVEQPLVEVWFLHLASIYSSPVSLSLQVETLCTELCVVGVERAPVISTYHTRYLPQFPYLSMRPANIFPFTVRSSCTDTPPILVVGVHAYVVLTTAASSLITAPLIIQLNDSLPRYSNLQTIKESQVFYLRFVM